MNPPSFTRSLALLLLSGLSIAASSREVAAKPSFVVQPPPAWVQPLNIARTERAPTTGEGARYLLIDNQFRVTDKSTERY